MELDKEEFARIFTIFKEETEEHIQKLNEGFLSLEKEPGQPPLLSELFRHSHSVKGAARMMGFTSIEGVAHAMETILGKLQKEEINVDGDVMGALYKGVDFLAEIIECLGQGKAEEEIKNEEILEHLSRFAAAAYGNKSEIESPLAALVVFIEINKEPETKEIAEDYIKRIKILYQLIP